MGVASPVTISCMMTERTVCGPFHALYTPLQVKPDGVQRGLVGEIIGRFERKGFTLRGLKLFTPGRELAEEHYKDLSQKPFFKDLVNYITSGPVVAMVRTAPPTRASVKPPYLAARHSPVVCSSEAHLMQCAHAAETWKLASLALVTTHSDCRESESQ